MEGNIDYVIIQQYIYIIRTVCVTFINLKLFQSNSTSLK